MRLEVFFKSKAHSHKHLTQVLSELSTVSPVCTDASSPIPSPDLAAPSPSSPQGPVCPTWPLRRRTSTGPLTPSDIPACKADPHLSAQRCSPVQRPTSSTFPSSSLPFLCTPVKPTLFNIEAHLPPLFTTTSPCSSPLSSTMPYSMWKRADERAKLRKETENIIKNTRLH